jgi:hypothetical protein
LSTAKQPDNFHILYSSQNPNRLHQVNLLLLELNNRKHYILVNSMSRLIANRTKHNAKSFVGNSCLRASSYSADLENHKTYFRTNARQQVYYPNPAKEEVIEFRDVKKMRKLPFYLVCDFESYPVKQDDQHAAAAADATRDRDYHVPSGFACHRITDMEQYRTKPLAYSGEDVMENFLQHLFTESKELNAIMKINMPMKNLTPEQKQSCIFSRNPLFMSTEVYGEQSQMQASQLFEWRVH